MKRMSIDEMKANLGAAIEDVEINRQIIEITRRGRPIARMIPVLNIGSVDWDANGAWTALNALREQLRDRWPEDVSAQDIINDTRD